MIPVAKHPAHRPTAAALQCGSDEAGYGPNLGPLVVAATAWEVSHDCQESDLYALLDHAVASRPGGGKDRVVICDSKLLYSGPQGLKALETSALTLFQTAGLATNTCEALGRALCPDWQTECNALPWMEEDLPLPLQADPAVVAAWAGRLDTVCRQTGVRLAALRAAVLQPGSFNRRVRATNSKGAVLTDTTFSLLAAMCGAHPGVSAQIRCDQHGGRRRYAAALQQAFVEALIRVEEESAEQSVYAWEAGGAKTTLAVSPRSERFLSVAAASLVAKYLRELAMHRWNVWWQAQLPGLRSTAGYPVDARRFKSEIAPLQRTLQIPDDLLWRER